MAESDGGRGDGRPSRKDVFATHFPELQLWKLVEKYIFRIFSRRIQLLLLH